MSIAKTFTLSLAGAIILAAHPAPSFAESVSLNFSSVELAYTQEGAGGDEGESLWDYMCGLLW
jgi:hypothetical protein